MSFIRAELFGSDTCTALGVAARANAPVLLLCRMLVAAGHDPGTPLEAYRGDVFCLKMRTISEAAWLECGATGFRRRKDACADAIQDAA
jgi:hypothetical protein